MFTTPFSFWSRTSLRGLSSVLWTRASSVTVHTPNGVGYRREPPPRTGQDDPSPSNRTRSYPTPSDQVEKSESVSRPPRPDLTKTTRLAYLGFRSRSGEKERDPFICIGHKRIVVEDVRLNRLHSRTTLKETFCQEESK